MTLSYSKSLLDLYPPKNSIRTFSGFRFRFHLSLYCAKFKMTSLFHNPYEKALPRIFISAVLIVSFGRHDSREYQLTGTPMLGPIIILKRGAHSPPIKHCCTVGHRLSVSAVFCYIARAPPATHALSLSGRSGQLWRVRDDGTNKLQVCLSRESYKRHGSGIARCSLDGKKIRPTNLQPRFIHRAAPQSITPKHNATFR